MAELHLDVEVGAGSRIIDAGPLFEHPWTDAGIGVDTDDTGAHLLLVSVGVCVLNVVYREARPGIQLDGVLVRVAGDFDAETWSTTAITYAVEIDSPEDEATIARLLAQVDEVAEIPRVVSGEVTVGRR
ncbi:OsmC family protein [Nocardioides sp. URHA0020]|uniref:OsmC family protein n=1 Tax=Nocardioides sp. URHA0020 TaxID=1380392 RepID=UPI00048B0E07|nr:OsmC family protein [Nocardioides sp. URHA0020]